MRIRTLTIKGSIISMVGVVFGFVNTTILQPLVLNVAQIGLLRVVLSYSTLLSTIFSLGYNQVAAHVFPKMFKKDNKQGGFVAISAFIFLVGFFLSLITFLILKNEMASASEINMDWYVWSIIPIVFFMLVYNILDGYQVQLKKPLVGLFLKEVGFRLMVSFLFGLMLLGIFNFNQIFWLYSVALISPGLILFFIVLKNGELSFKMPTKATWQMVKPVVFSTMLYGALNNSTYILLREIDIVMLKQLAGLEETGIYSTLFYFGLMVSIPARSLKRASWSHLSFAWENNDLKEIGDIYQKSSLNQLIVGCFVFLMIWLNIDYIFDLMPRGDEFKVGKNVVLFIGLYNVLNMGMGVSSEIILTSKYYKLNFLMSIGLVLLIGSFNLWLIPEYGAVGAAIGTFMAFVIYNLVRYFFLWITFGLQPFKWMNALILIVVVAIYFLGSYWKTLLEIDNTILAATINSVGITFLFGLFVLTVKPSDDIADRLHVYSAKLLGLFKSKD